MSEALISAAVLFCSPFASADHATAVHQMYTTGSHKYSTETSPHFSPNFYRGQKCHFWPYRSTSLNFVVPLLVCI